MKTEKNFAPVEIVKPESTQPEVSISIANAGVVNIDPVVIRAQMETILNSMAATQSAELEKITKIDVEVPVAVVVGSPCIKAVHLRNAVPATNQD